MFFKIKDILFNSNHALICFFLQEKLESFVAAGKELDVYRLLHLCTLEVILKCAFSYDLDVQLKG